MSSTSTVHFTIYGRPWCHLCDDMLEALKAHPQAKNWRIDTIDIDNTPHLDPQRVEAYDELIPVLTGEASKSGQQTVSAPEQICHYFLDPAALSAFLIRHGFAQPPD